VNFSWHIEVSVEHSIKYFSVVVVCLFGTRQAKKFTSGMKFDRKFMIIVTANNDVHVSCLKVKNVAFLTCNGCSNWRILDDKSNM